MKEPRTTKKSPAAAAVPGVDFEQVEKLLDFMTAHGLEEFEYEHGGLHIRLRKGAAGEARAPLARASEICRRTRGSRPRLRADAGRLHRQPAPRSAPPRSCTSSSRRSWEHFTGAPSPELRPL